MGIKEVITTGGLFISLALCGGCGEMNTKRYVDSRANGHATIVSQHEAVQRAWQFRKQADELREAAHHYELEAAVQAKTRGEDSDTVRRANELAKEFSAAADQADEQMFQYQRQVPHGQIH